MRIMRAGINSRIMPALCLLLLKTNYAQNYASIIFTPLKAAVSKGVSIILTTLVSSVHHMYCSITCAVRLGVHHSHVDK